MRHHSVLHAAAATALVLAAQAGAAQLEMQTDSDLCSVEGGEQVLVSLFMSDLGTDEAAGFQAFLQFDESRLALVSGSYPAAPFGLPIIDPIVAVDGLIAMAAGVDSAGGQNPTSTDGVVVELLFDVLAGDGAPMIGLVNHKPPNRVSDEEGNPLPLILISGPPPSCSADLNGDGAVAIQDLILLMMNWDQECPGDLINDGVVNIEDLIELLIRWGTCPAVDS